MAYRILTLDGGGSWALIEVKALIRIFGANTRGNEVLQQFDLVAANSGGSIVLGGLVENVPLGTLLGYFMNQSNRHAIFSPTSSWGDKALEATLKIGPKYSAAAKLPALENLMPRTGNMRMNGITTGLNGPAGDPVRLMIVGFDYDRNRAAFFRSVQVAGVCLGVEYPDTITLAEAIHASTNAPINYFDSPAVFPERRERYWDGGVSGFNNPILAAVTEAVSLGVKHENIAALSLGTGSVQLQPAIQSQVASPYFSSWQDSSLLNDLKKMASSILDDPPDSASYIAHIITLAGPALPTGVVSRIVRMSPLVSPVMNAAGQWTPPGGMTAAAFQALCNIDMDAVAQTEVNAISSYADLWLNGNAPNQLIHTNGAAQPTGIGYSTFAAALNAWQAISHRLPNEV